MTIIHRPAFIPYPRGERQCRELPADSPYIPPEARAATEAEAAERVVSVEPPGDPLPMPPEQPLAVLERHIRRIVEENRRQNEAKRNRLAEIASLVGALTYGEMIELAEGLWKCRPEDAEVSAATELPAIIHKWSTER